MSTTSGNVTRLNDIGNTTIVTNAFTGKWRTRCNRFVARIDGSNQLISGTEFKRLIRSGHDVEAVGSECETGA